MKKYQNINVLYVITMVIGMVKNYLFNLIILMETTRIIEQRVNTCKDYGKKILKQSEKCTARKNKIYRKFNASKEDLERLIFNENKPFTEIGKIYGVTDNAIKKRCNTFGIVIPRYNKRKNKK